MSERSKKTRREFMTDAALVAGASVAAGCFPDTGGDWAEACEHSGLVAEPLTGAAPVVAVHDPSSVDTDSAIRDEAVAPMLEEALSGLAGDADPWPVLLPDYVSGMRIGLKVNCLNPSCPTSVPVTRALVDSLKAGLGLSTDEIVVWDRRLDELTTNGFTEESVGARVVGTVMSTSDASGPGYEDCFCELPGGKRTHLSRILTEETDLTISVPVLKTHEVSGVTAGMKNIYGVIDNPGRFHSDLNTALPALYALAPIREHIRLTVVDALVAVTVGGTASPKDTIPRRLFVSADPVAVDSYAIDLVNQLRADKDLGLPDVPSGALTWIDNAHQLGLGQRQYDLLALTR